MSYGKRGSKKNNNNGYIWAIVCLVAVTAFVVAMITVLMSQILSQNKGEDIPEPTTTVSPTQVSKETTNSVTTPRVTPKVTEKDETKAPNTQTDKPLPPPVTTDKTEEPKEPDVLDFVADLSEFERYMNPTGQYWDDAYLLLVNTKHTLKAGQEDTYPILAPKMTFAKSKDYAYKYYTSLSMNEYAMKALSAMFIEGAANGIKGLDITSAYRSYSRQQSIFSSNCSKTHKWVCENDGTVWIGKSSSCPECKRTSKETLAITQEEIEANVATYSCAPGTSDHQTGLAVDIVQTTLSSRYVLTQIFGDTEAGKWLEENSWKFGFVLRFPADKEDITGIIWEPWHFRFVGRTHAAKMKELNMCLEEYVEYLTETGYFD